MEDLYHQTNRLIQEAQQYFQQLERNPQSSEDLENAIQTKISSITSNCERLDILVFKAPVTQRQIAKMRCDQLKYDNRHMQAALNSLQERRHRHRQEVEERQQLLSRRFVANDAPQHTSIEVDGAVQHHNSLHNAHRGMDDMLMTGSNVLSSLQKQRDTLKGARKRIIDLANTLGLSNHTISIIERRARQDKFLLIGGMLVTLCIITIVVMYYS